ncbi:MAG: helix-turn-helix domain-containing protein [Clostridia bacterium]|nr:helix-turn-helix domain-containing protein [Clostridia bacterium]
MDNFNYISEFKINIEDITVEILCDNPPDEISKAYRKNAMKKTIPLHNHIYYEIFHLTEGSASLNFENTSVTLSKNSIVLVPPMEFHAIKPLAVDVKSEAIDFIFMSNKLKSSFPLYNKLAKALTSPFSVFEGEKIVDITQKLHYNIESGNYSQISILFHQLILLIIELSGQTKNDSVRNSTDTNMKRLYKIQQYISRNITEDIRIETIANSVFLSTRQINRIFKMYFGCSFKEYLVISRMNAAAELLRSTDYSITEIYQKVGYNSAQAFYRAFQNRFSCTPTEYREKYK